MAEHPERECVSCGERGHWYLDCPTVPFWPLLAAAFRLPVYFDPPAQDSPEPQEAKP